MGATRPYLLVLKGEKHIIEAPGAAHAVQHVVGADISELRPARAAEVTAWVREGKTIPIAGETVAAAAQVESSPGVETKPGKNDLIAVDLETSSRALIFFEDWAGFDRNAEANTVEADDTVRVFANMHLIGQMDLMTFDVLRQRAPEFGFAIVADEMAVQRSDDAIYVPSVQAAMGAGLPRVRARLEDQPMLFIHVAEAIIRHAGQEKPVA